MKPSSFLRRNVGLLSRYAQQAANSNPVTRIVNLPDESSVIYQEKEYEDWRYTVGILYRKNDFGSLDPVSIPVQLMNNPDAVIKHLSGQNHNSATKYQLREVSPRFDPVVFSKFTELLNPVVVENLGLNRGKADNIDLYNLCISSKSETLSERVVRNRSKLLGLFPLFRDIKDFRPEILPSFDEGNNEKALKEFRKYLGIHDDLTQPSVIKRCSNAKFAPDAKFFCKMVNYALGLPQGEKFNKKSYEKLISNIPNPHETREYEAMWDALRDIQRLEVSDEVKSCLFRNIERNWIKDAATLNEGFSGKVSFLSETIANDLLLPAYIAQFNKMEKQSDSGKIPDLMILFNNGFVADVRAELAKLVQETILSNSKPKEIVECYERLDRRAGEILESKPILKKRLESTKDDNAEFKPEWHELFPPQTVEMPDGSYHFRCLNSSAELNAWSKKMNNCLHTFDSRCSAGVCHIILGVDPEGLEFAIRLNHLAVSEVENANVKSATITAREAAEHLSVAIKEGKIKSNPNKGALDFHRTIDETVGFEVRNEQAVQEVYNVYQNSKILPESLRGLSREDFLQQSGFVEFFAKRKSDHVAMIHKNPSTAVRKPNISAEKKTDLRLLKD